MPNVIPFPVVPFPVVPITDYEPPAFGGPRPADGGGNPSPSDLPGAHAGAAARGIRFRAGSRAVC